MEKFLLLKILGKKYSVILDDEVYNLKLIAEDLREINLNGLSIETDFVNKSKEDINKAIVNLKEISEFLASGQVIGYTNSKNYLTKYIDDLILHSIGIVENIKEEETKELIFHSNMLRDLLLVY